MFDVEVMDEPVYTDRHSPACSHTQRAYIIKTWKKRRETTSLTVWWGATGHDIGKTHMLENYLLFFFPIIEIFLLLSFCLESLLLVFLRAVFVYHSTICKSTIILSYVIQDHYNIPVYAFISQKGKFLQMMIQHKT